MSELVIIRGAGDIATGVIQKFHRSGFRVLALECEKPTAIRRNVALCEAVYQGSHQVEDISCEKISRLEDAEGCWSRGIVPVYVDEEAHCVRELKPKGLIDCILAKRNLGTNLNMAPITIALGPGFTAEKDVNAVIETMRGHNLGRLILNGEAMPNTGVPGEIGGRSQERVIHSPCDGAIRHIRDIGDIVQENEPIFTVDDAVVHAPFKGLIRGLIRDGFYVHRGMKISDIDPRTNTDYKTISDKARCVGGAALEAYLYFSSKRP